MGEPTFWNYEPCEAWRQKIKVGKAERPTFWYANLDGTTREAVGVNYHGHVFYLDNEDGSGWAKVTKGRGGPDWPHNSLPNPNPKPTTGIKLLIAEACKFLANKRTPT